jgi:type I restriction enzyme M protein
VDLLDAQDTDLGGAKNMRPQVVNSKTLASGLVDLARWVQSAPERRSKQMLALWTLKYLNENEDHPYVIPEGAKWAEVAKSGVLLSERLRRAFSEIERANPRLEGIFTRIEVLREDEPRVFQFMQFLGKVWGTGAEVDDPDPLTGTFAQIIDAFIDGLIPVEKMYASSWGIVELIAKIAALDSGTVYDPAAGINRLLIQMVAASRNRSQLRLFGQERNEYAWSIGQFNLILHGIYDATIWHGDTLEDPASIHQDQLTRFDRVVMDPPIGQIWDPTEADRYGRFLYGIPGRTSGDMAFVLHAISSLADSGKAVCVVSPGLLTRGGTLEKIRRNMVVDDLIEAIIALPGGLYLRTSMPMYLVVVNKAKERERKGKILLIDAGDAAIENREGERVLSREAFDRILDTYNSFSAVEEYSYLVSVEDVESHEWRLAPSMYVTSNEVVSLTGGVCIDPPTFQVYPDRYLKSDTPKKPLSQIARIFRGIQPPRQSVQESHTFKIVNVSDIQDGEIVMDTLSTVSLEDPKHAEKSELRSGDVLISCRGTVLKIAVVPQNKERMVISQNLIGVRLNEGYDPYFLKSYLESPLGVQFLQRNQRGTTMTVLLPRDIEDIPVPDILVDKQRELVQRITQARQEFNAAIKTEIAKRDAEYQKAYNDMGLKDAFCLRETESFDGNS